MKSRIDFVTNSSSSSFVIFHIKSKTLMNFLNDCGIKVCGKGSEDNIFTNEDTTLILPSGKKIKLDSYYLPDEAIYTPTPDPTSLSEWFMDYITCGLYLGEDRYSDYYDECLSEEEYDEDAWYTDLACYAWKELEPIVEAAKPLPQNTDEDEAHITTYGESMDAIYGRRQILKDGNSEIIGFYFASGDYEFDDEDEDAITYEDVSALYSAFENFDGSVFDLAENKGLAFTDQWVLRNGKWVEK